MTGETERNVSGWTTDTYAAHNEAILKAAEKFAEERDRRYTEVGVEREKALKIKETADLAALGLAREIQTYKDEKANQLREQINSERGQYATKDDLTSAVSKIEVQTKPIADYVTGQQGGPRALTTSGVLAVVAVLGVLASVWLAGHRTTVVTPQTVTVTTTKGSP